MLQLHLRLLRAGELSRKEGGKIFGAGSRNTVAIFIGIKTPTHTGPCHIHYHDIGDYLTREQKLAAVAEGSLDNVDWTPVTPNTEGDWINQRDPTFPTGRDTWCYNYSRQSLSSNMRELIDQYDAVVEAFRVDFRGSRPDEQDITRFLQAHPEFTGNGMISWNRSIKQLAARNVRLVESDEAFRLSVYRPFQKQDSVPLSGGLRIWRGFTHCDQRVMLNVMRFGVVWQALQRRVSSR